MKKIKKKKMKEQPLLQDDNYQFKNMIVIIAVIVIVLIPLYFITSLVIGDKTKNEEIKEEKNVEINKEQILVDQLLNRPYNEYYVLAYKKDNKLITIFNNYLDNYKNKEDSLTIYRIDLDDALNKSHIGSETYITDELKDLTISDTVLFKIVDGKIDSYYIGNDEVVKFLKEING